MSKNQTIIVRQSNGMGTAGFILALLSLILIWIPILNFIIWALGLLFSFIGLFKRPRGLAIAGFIISSIGIVIMVVFFAGALAFLGSLDGEMDDNHHQNDQVIYDSQKDRSDLDESKTGTKLENQNSETDYPTNNEVEIIKNDFINSVIKSIKTYEGFINNKYGIIVKLTREANSLKGTYRYTSQQAYLQLTGEIDETGQFVLNEYDNDGKLTGVFEGNLIDETMKGTWRNPDGSKSYPFSCQENKNETQKILVQEKRDILDLSIIQRIEDYFHKEYGEGTTREVVKNDTVSKITYHTIPNGDEEYSDPPLAYITIPLTKHQVLEGDLNNDDKSDLAITVLVHPGGSNSLYHYVFIFLQQNESYRLGLVTAAWDVSGCRGDFYARTIEDNFIIGNSSCYGEDDPQCCPSLEYETKVAYKDGELKFVSKRLIKSNS